MSDQIVMLKTMRVPGVMAALEDYSSFKISNGYGRLARAQVEATKGVTAHIDVEFLMTTVSTQDMTKWLSENKHYFSDEQWHTLEENHAAGGFLGGVLAGAFGFLFGGGSYNHYKNSHDKEVKVDDQKQEGFVKSLHDTTTTQVTVRGRIDATGLSNIPSVGCVFVESTSVEFNDGTSIHVINSSDPIVASPDGSVGDFDTPSGQKLDIIPLA